MSDSGSLCWMDIRQHVEEKFGYGSEQHCRMAGAEYNDKFRNPFDNGEWDEETEERGPTDWEKLTPLFEHLEEPALVSGETP